jgi:hypothetical protein
MTSTTDVYVPPFPHEPLDGVEPNVTRSPGPDGWISTTWLACRHCSQWYPQGSPEHPVGRCAWRASAARRAAAQ